MSLAPFKTTTALFASLSLLLPHTALVTSAAAQEVELLCLDESEPPCPEGEPEQGSTPMERADFVAAQAARLAEEAQEAARLIEEEAAAASEEATRLEQEAADAAEADQAQAQAEAERAALAAAEVEAQVEALRAEAEAAEAEAAQLAAEAEAQAADAAAAETETQAVDEAAAAEAEAEAQAAQDAASAEEAATVEAEAQAAEQAAAAEAEAQAAEEAQVAEDVATAEAEAEAQAAEEAETADPEAIAAEEQTETEAETGAEETDAADTTALVDPTVVEDDEVPAAAMAETASEPEAVVEETLDAQSVRSSEQDFATAIGSEESSASSGNESSGMSNLEKALLLGLGAVVVGSVLRNGDRVVENTGDRVVVESPDGFTVYKDDDALLRQPGAMMRTETFADGSTSTTLTREDGSQVVTIRDARGRVLRREAIYPDGTRYELFDDLQASAAVDVRQLQATRPVPRSLSVAENDLAALRAALRADMAFDPDRTFSLRQIREIEQVRSLVPAIDLDTVTFASGSAAIPTVQARSLVRLGNLIEELLLENPREVFLIEGHTDAAGSESYNLALSDRRAESVALALTEAFRIPPENLIVQGYGESFLKVQTEAAEERNRRATVRRITPLLREIAAN